MYLKHGLPKSQSGIGLPATIFLITIVALIVVAMSELNESSSLGFGQDINSMRAFYAAESGVQIALNRRFVGLETCAAIDGTVLNFTADGLQGCSATVACDDVSVASEQYDTFSSWGSCGAGLERATRALEVRAKN